MLIKKYSVSLVVTLCLSASILASTTLNIGKGWQLVGSNIYNIKDPKEILKNVDLIWMFEDGVWKVLSPNGTYNKYIESIDIPIINGIKAGKGFWVKSTKEDITVYLDDKTKSLDPIFVKKGWNLLSLKKEKAINLDNIDKKFNDIYLIWKFQDGKWFYYTNNDKVKSFIVNSNIIFKSFKILNPTDGFWYRSLDDGKVEFKLKNTAPTLTLSTNKVSLDEGKSAEVTVTTLDPDGDSVTVGVKSSDESKATASYANGKITITGVAEGNATITVEATDGDKKVSKDITVNVKSMERFVNTIANSFDLKISDFNRYHIAISLVNDKHTFINTKITIKTTKNPLPDDKPIMSGNGLTTIYIVKEAGGYDFIEFKYENSIYQNKDKFEIFIDGKKVIVEVGKVRNEDELILE